MLLCDLVRKSSTVEFRCPIVRPRIGSKSEECGNYPLHFFWSTFFTSSHGNPLIGKEIDSYQKRKRPWKKVKMGRERPHFFGFEPPKKCFGVAPALRHTNRA